MPKDTDSGELTEQELLEAWEILKEYAPLTPEQAWQFFEELGGFKKVTPDLYEALLRDGNFELAGRMLQDAEARAQSSDPEIAELNAEVLASMKHDA